MTPPIPHLARELHGKAPPPAVRWGQRCGEKRGKRARQTDTDRWQVMRAQGWVRKEHSLKKMRNLQRLAAEARQPLQCCSWKNEVNGTEGCEPSTTKRKKNQGGQGLDKTCRYQLTHEAE